MARTVLTIFLSSTGQDLEAYRAEVRRQTSACEFFKCIAMEEFGPKDSNALDYCRAKAREADLFVGLIGLRRGWEPPGDPKQRSITEIEYDAATEFDRPRFISLAPDDFDVPPHLADDDGAMARQRAFRQRVNSERVAGVHNFTAPATLAAEIMNSLLSHVISGDLIRLLRPDLAGARPEEAQKPLAAAFQALAAEDDVDLLALARDPAGIDLPVLEAKLQSRAEAHEQSTASHADAAAAERRSSAQYYKHLGALAFLGETKKSLAAYTKVVELDADDAEAWNQLGILLQRVGALDEAIGAYERVRIIGQRTNVPELEAIATGNLGIIFEIRGDMDRAEAMYRNGLVIEQSLGRKEGIANDYGNLGNIFAARGDFQQAEEMFIMAGRIFEDLENNEGLAAVCGNLGNIYTTRGALDRAEEMYLTAIRLDEGMGRQEGIANHSGNLGTLYVALGQLDKAEELYRRTLAIELAIGRKEGTANAYSSLAGLCLRRGDLQQADGLYYKALELNEELGSIDGIATQHANLGVLARHRGDHAAACMHWRKSRDLFRAIQSPHFAKIQGFLQAAEYES